MINPDLTEQERRELDTVLDKAAEVFSDLPGKTSLAEHSITTTPGRIIKQKPYRIPVAKRSIIQQEVQDMLRLGVIQPSTSEWSSPIVLVPKPDGSTRFCMDFRALNSISTFDAYPIPRIDELIEKLGEAKYITTIDLTKGYWQVPLRKEDRKKTAFATADGLYEFTVLPFGLHGAPATFQRLMNTILREYPGFSSAYLDDIVVFSPSWKEHLQHLQTIMQTLQKANLHVNSKKTRVAFQKVKYLGYVLGHGLITPQTEKVRAIVDTPFPKTKKEV